MAELFKNLKSTTLAEDLDDSETGVDVASAMGFAGGNFRILVDQEIMKVTAVSGTTLTVARGQEGTFAAVHSNGATVKHILTAGSLDAHDQVDLASYDLYASRPAAGTPGRIFLPSDGLFLERDNGSSWEKFGPIWPMTPPLASDFPRWVNQGTSTFTDVKGAPFLQGQLGTSTNVRARVKDYPTSSFTVEMAFTLNCWPYSTSLGLGGLLIRDSISMKFVTFGAGGQSSDLQVQAYNWNSPISASGSVTGSAATHFGEAQLFWLKYYDDFATNRVISASVDGYNWVQIVSIGRTDWIVPNEIGVCVNGYAGYSASYGQCDSGLNVLHWRLTM